jgi:hypothetical protein
VEEEEKRLNSLSPSVSREKKNKNKKRERSFVASHVYE